MCDCDGVKTRTKRRTHVIYVRQSTTGKTCSSPLKALVVLLAFMVLCCLILLNLYLIEREKTPTQTYGEKAANTTRVQPKHGRSYGGSCWTSDCLRAALDLLDSVDPSEDPCEDFFNYACGGWAKRNTLPNGSKIWDQFLKLLSKNDKLMETLLKDKEIRAKYSKEDAVLKTFTFYDSCTDVQSIERLKGEPLVQLIKGLGSWSITDKQWNETGWDLAAKLAEIHKNLERFVFFQMAVSIDPKNSSQYVIAIMASPLKFIRAKEIIGNDTSSHRTREAYQGMMRNLSRKLGATEDSEAELLEIFDFERELAKIATPYNPLRQFSFERHCRRVTLRDLQETTGNYMNWTRYIQLMVKEASVQIDESEEICVVDIEFFKRLGRLISVTPKRIIANYLMWAVVKGDFFLLSSDFLEIYKNFYQQTLNVWSDTERQRLCVTATSIRFPMPLSKVFLDHLKFDAESKRRAKEIIEDIRATFVSNLRRADWLDEDTKRTAIKKAEAVIENVGFPDYLMAVDYLSKEYKELAIHPMTYFENYVAARKSDHLRKLAKVGKPVRKSDWSMTPMDVNAFYSNRQNKMIFPAAVLQPPFYNVLYPRAINYGAIGGIMAHEITHGFDDNGNKFDSQGNRRKWWSNATLKVFHEKSQCLVKQYSNFTLFGLQVNGKTTLSENIADNGAVRVAYDAYRKWVTEHWEEPRLPGTMLTNDQIFFISYAKNMCGYVNEELGKRLMMFPTKHSPRPWRVNGALMNFPGFSKAFNCRLGSPMNPEKKCKVW